MKRPLAEVVGQGIWYALGNALGKVGGLLLLPILTNAQFLSPDDFGRWGVMEVTVQIGIIVVGLQLATAVLRFFGDADAADADATAFWFLVLVLGSLSVVLVLAVLPAIHADWRPIAIGLSLYVAAEALLTIPLATIRASGRAPIYTLVLIARLVLVILLVYALVMVRAMELRGLVTAYAGASSAALVVALVVSRRSVLIRPRIRRPLLGRMVVFSSPLILAGIGSMALNAADRYILIAMRSAEEVALYTLAVKFGGVINMFVAQPLQLALYPVLFQTDVALRASLIRSLTRMSVALLALLTVGISVFAGPLVRLIGADEFYLDAVPLIAWVAIGFSIFAISIIYDGILILYRKTGQTSLWFTVAAVANLLLNLAIIPVLGALGAAITTLVSYGLLLAGRVWAARGLLAIEHRIGPLVGITLSAIVVCVLANVVVGTSIVVDLSLRVALLGSWLGVVWVARWVGRADIHAIRGLIGRTGDGNDVG